MMHNLGKVAQNGSNKRTEYIWCAEYALSIVETFVIEVPRNLTTNEYCKFNICTAEHLAQVVVVR